MSLPTRRGSTKRQTWLFRNEAAADAWLEAGKRALHADQALPMPEPGLLVQGRTGARVASGTSFRVIASRWKEERYVEMGLAGPSREDTVDRHIKRIADWMEHKDCRLVMETMVRDRVKELQEFLIRGAERAPTVPIPTGLDPEQLVTILEAAALPGMASLSTLKRRVKAGILTAGHTGPGAHLYKVGDLYCEEVLDGPDGLRTGPRTGGALSQNVASDAMWIFNEVCLFADDYGVNVPQDRKSLPMHRSDRERKPKHEPVSIGRCADVAARLHVVHQLALWLMRLLGLRIGEAFGVRVGSIIDRGEGEPGVLLVKEQGGRKMRSRKPGERYVTIADQTVVLKTHNSYRVLVVPSALMDLIRTTIAVFHTNTDGSVRTADRLVPGLKRRNAGGQQAFRAALSAAAAEVAIELEQDEVDATFSLAPHDMRRSVLSDLDRFEVKDTHARRFGGHAAGADVHGRHYVLDDPKLRPMKKIAKRIQKEVTEALPAGLHIPTMVSCTTNNQPALALEGRRIDAELAERGWLLLPSDGDDVLVGAGEVAELLGIAVQEARRRMADGRIPSTVWSERARGSERRSRLSDVRAIKALQDSHVSIRSIAEEFGTTYHTVYQFVLAQGYERRRINDREYVLTTETAQRVRAHYQTQAALHARAIPFSVAVEELGATLATVEQMVRDGILDADEPAHDGRRMVTRDSVRLALVARAGPERVRRSDLYSWPEALALTGWSDARLTALAHEGKVKRVEFNRRRHVTCASLLRYLAAEDPELLVVALSASAT
ncbi:hypothetical protein [Nocardioides sp. Arc9.136]|uniref:hypothetical protein n=1 Tax=Nocardioides sp. Arc9.136 TaxID=2996826 RepID=UPI0026659876|nr:hypothetical protein [Nocardioides sp. Arc9.136]WKN47472.1 hypothetical protein OSR43_15700 [Nocardioides sp. Arc9.136]